jgi:hypothetical protein
VQRLLAAFAGFVRGPVRKATVRTFNAAHMFCG